MHISAKIKKAICSSLEKTLESDKPILGKAVGLFEKKLASWIGVKYAIGVNTGTDALFYGLKTLGIGTSDEIITTPFSFSATADAIVMAGARPVFVDIEPEAFNINPRKIEKAITKKTKAIILVYLYGQPFDPLPFLKIARKYNLKIIEDNAQSLGSKYKNKFLGTFGDLGCLSFYPTKNLAAAGDGGAIVTNSARIARILRQMRMHGARKMYYKYDFIGGSSRLHTLQAAVLNVRLKYLDWFIGQRRKIADFYRKEFFGQPFVLQLPREDKFFFHSFNSFTIRIKKRNQVFRFLKRKNMPVNIYYPKPVHLFSTYRFLGYKAGAFPEAEKACREVLSLPTDSELKSEVAKTITVLIKNFFNKK